MKNINANWLTTASNAPSRNGSDSADPNRQSIVASQRPATANIPPLASSPVTEPVGPTRSNAACAATPVEHWRDRGDWNLQWSTLRNLVDFLAGTGSDAEAGVIIEAVDAHGPPAYGLEADRFERARSRVADRLGATELARLEAIGRSLTGDELLDYALAAAKE